MFRYRLSNYSRLHAISVIVIVTVLYFFLGLLGIMLGIPQTNVSSIWPAAGVALAAVVLFGYWTLVGIFLGSFFLNIAVLSHIFSFSQDWLKIISVSLATGGGAALQAAAGGALLFYFIEKNLFSSPQTVFKFMFIALVTCLINSNIGVLSLAFSGLLPWNLYPEALWTWWVGDTSGIFTITPLLYTWTIDFPRRLSWPKVFEAIVLGIAVIFVAYLTTLGYFTYLLYPCILWAIFRFHLQGATLFLYFAFIILLIESRYGYGPFAKQSVNYALLLLSIFTIVVTGSTLVLAAKLETLTQKTEVWIGTHRKAPNFIISFRKYLERWTKPKKK